MPELVIKIREYIGESEFNWDTLEFEWATNAADVRMAVEWAQLEGTEVDSICLEIGTCFGGSTVAGMEIYNYLQELGLPVRTRILALAASMGTVLPLVGDTIEIDATALLLVHGPSGYAMGTVAHVTSDLKMLADTHQLLRDVYVARTGQPVEVVEEWMSKDTFFTAAEALAAGLVTKVIPIAPKSAPVLSDAQASARRAKYAGITARADKRTLKALAAPTPKTKPTAAAQAAPTPRPMATSSSKKPAAKPVAPKAAAPTAAQSANLAAVKAFAKQLGVAITAEVEGTAITVVAEMTTLADGAGMLYHDGELAVDTAVFNDEALTVPTADGDYEDEEGRTITVAAGLVSAITEATAEAEAATTSAAIADAITAALAPFTARLAGLEATFNKAVPPTPRPVGLGAQGADTKIPAPKGRGLLAGASATK